MSAIAGVLRRDGGRTEAAAVERMLAALGWRASGPPRAVARGPVTLGHLPLATTDEARSEAQPFSAGSALVVLDGRIDERERLRDDLAAAGFAPRGGGDAELLLRAYEAWGETAPARVLGDFAFAIWDGRQLVCGRDYVGVRPFFLARTAGAFVFASEPRAVLEAPGVARTADEGWIAEVLSGCPRSLEDTLFLGVKRLPPAHVLVVSSSGERLARYWTPPADRLERRDPRERGEHVRAVLERAVACRLRSSGVVASELSGGVDSSSVVGLARALEGRTPSRHGPLETFSLSFPEHSVSDEGVYVSAVDARWSQRTTRVEPEILPLAGYAALAARRLSFPGFPNGVMGASIRRAASERGIRVLLTGLGGDEVFGGSDFRLADLVAAGRVADLLGEARWSRPWWSLLVQCGLRPLVPPSVRRAWRTVRPAKVAVPWLGQAILERPGVAERLASPSFGPNSPAGLELASLGRWRVAQRDAYALLRSGTTVHALELEASAASELGIELRHPFLDRRVVELGLRLPLEDLLWRGQGKRALRRALRGVLPDAVSARRDKAHFWPVFAGSLLSAEVRALLASPRIETLGWIDGVRVRAMLEALREEASRGPPGATEGHAWPLWSVVGIELWHRALGVG